MASVTKRLSRAAASWRLFSGAKWGNSAGQSAEISLHFVGNLDVGKFTAMPGRFESHTQRRQRLRLYAQLHAYSHLASLVIVIKVSVWKVDGNTILDFLISSDTSNTRSKQQSPGASCCVAIPSRNGIQLNF